MLALAGRLSGLRAVAQRCAGLLQDAGFNALSEALARPAPAAFVRRLLEHLTPPRVSSRPEELVAVDSMLLSLPATRRHRCARLNRAMVGGGVLWTLQLGACAGVCPVRVLATMRRAWHDTVLMRRIPLLGGGPVYLMDRGFYALDLIERWLEGQVHFIVRARQRSLVYELFEELSPPRRVGAKWLLLDGCVRLGGKTARHRPWVRLVIARLAGGEELILVSDRWGWSAERILAAYKQRWQIERWHKWLKDGLGLAHLYSFAQAGLEFLLHTAVLMAVLLVLGEAAPTGSVLGVLRRGLQRLRACLGLGTPWRRNSCLHTRARRNKRKKVRAQPGPNP